MTRPLRSTGPKCAREGCHKRVSWGKGDWAKFCSADCHKAHRKRNTHKRKCAICSRDFEAPSWRPDKQTCSRRCNGLLFLKRRGELKKHNVMGVIGGQFSAMNPWRTDPARDRKRVGNADGVPVYRVPMGASWQEVM